MTANLTNSHPVDTDEITFDNTVPKALVDRGDPTTVLITSWVRDGDRLTAGACWPRLGGFYTLLDPDRHDPLLALETGRQCALLAAHVLADVPLATMQIMRRLTLEIVPSALAVGPEPTEVVVQVERRQTTPGQGWIVQMDLPLSVYRGDVLVARGLGQAVIPPEQMYLGVRGRDPKDVALDRQPLPEPVSPAAAGRVLARDVVISPDPERRDGVYQLRVDLEHANFFDNPTDHTPGMLLIEAMRQAILVESGNPEIALLGLDVEFTAFAELDSPAAVVVRRTPDGYRTEVTQFDRSTAKATWTTDG